MHCDILQLNQAIGCVYWHLQNRNTGLIFPANTMRQIQKDFVPFPFAMPLAESPSGLRIIRFGQQVCADFNFNVAT